MSGESYQNKTDVKKIKLDQVYEKVSGFCANYDNSKNIGYLNL